MADNVSILKNPQLAPATDYNFLRAQGLDYIEALGNTLWTDYNIHDPGITLLEALCYAITDLGYRSSFDIKDILALPPKQAADPDMQALYTAKNILTVNPLTVNDFRKLIIDTNGVKNAWLKCLTCPCDIFLYANCVKSELQYTPTEHTIAIKGIYDVKVEFEDNLADGDLNSGKILHTFNFAGANNTLTSAVIEMRLPSYKALEANDTQMAFFTAPPDDLLSVDTQFISGNKGDNKDITQADLAQRLRTSPMYATLNISLDSVQITLPAGNQLLMPDQPFTIWFNSDADRKAIQLADIKAAINDIADQGIIPNYFAKIKSANEVMAGVRNTLMAHRNLCEDYCSITAVETQDIAVCADIDVTPDSDIEQVMAQAYFLIDQYFSPPINFYSLAEMVKAGYQVDEIFNGPALSSGFIQDDQLQSAQLKTELHTSDIYATLMNIPGVLAVRELLLASYTSEGVRQTSQPWVLTVDAGKQARLYVNASKFLVFKNGLPFLPDKAELNDTLNVIKGSSIRPKFSTGDNEIAVPTGRYVSLTDYYPVQYSLPLTYGVGYFGLPQNVGNQRKAQAKQLKAYLLFYEQLLADYLEQLSHVKDLFSLDTGISKTYYTHTFNNDNIRDIEDVFSISDTDLQAISESPVTFLDRRNRFLDHLLSRFSEQFNDYALMLYSYADSKKIADELLIKDKITFIKDIPFTSSNRARAYDYKNTAEVCSDNNIAGIKKRIEQVLGLKQFDDYIDIADVTDEAGNAISRHWNLTADDGKVWLVSSADYLNDKPEDARLKVKTIANDALKFFTNPANYSLKKVKQWNIIVKDDAGKLIAKYPESFSKSADATAYINTIITFINSLVNANKIFVVEHLLLRPRNRPGALIPNGDALLPIYLTADCNVCGDEDPYSFRLSVVMNGENGLANAGIQFRRFAENTIRMEVPAHLGVKICWISDTQLQTFEALYCAWQTELAQPKPDTVQLSVKLKNLIAEFSQLKNIYPKATLHDCVDGDDQNRVYLNQTII